MSENMEFFFGVFDLNTFMPPNSSINGLILFIILTPKTGIGLFKLNLCRK